MFKLNLNSLGIIFLLCSNVWSFSILKLLPLLNILGLHLRNLDLLRRCSVLLKGLLSLQIHKFKKSTINFWLWLYAWCFFFKIQINNCKNKLCQGYIKPPFFLLWDFFPIKIYMQERCEKIKENNMGRRRLAFWRYQL